MSTYRLRLRFHIAHKGLISGDSESLEFSLPNGHPATLNSVDSKKFSEATKFVILSGGYKTEEEALQCGYRIKDAVLLYGTKFRIGVDLGKDKATGFLATPVKEKIFNDHGVRMIDDVHGVVAYSEEYPTSCMSMSAVGLINVREAGFFANELRELLCEEFKVSGQIKLAMELLTSSFFESSVRAIFLTLVLAAESILKPNDRSDEAKELVDELISRTESSNISEAEKSSIRGSLKWLYKDSISQSLRAMAEKYLTGKKYDGLEPERFIKKCYDARSKLVHSGSVDDSKYNIGGLAGSLELYMKDILIALSGL